MAPGGAVITSGHDLPNDWVIHCVGPRWGVDEPADDLLASCYREALRIADERGIRSIAFPAISTCIYGFPLERAARIALRTVRDEGTRRPDVELVRFVLEWGEHCEVLGPESLRDRVVAELEHALARYARRR